MIRLLGVVPLLGATESHVNPTGLVVAVAVKFSTVESVLVTATVCCAAAAFGSRVMLMVLVLTSNRALSLTFSVTGMLSAGVSELGTLSVMFPVQTFGVVRPVVFTETITWF